MMGRRETTFVSVVILCCFLSELKQASVPSDTIEKGLGKHSMQLKSLQRILGERHLHKDMDDTSSFFHFRKGTIRCPMDGVLF